MTTQLVRRSRRLSLVLRHKPESVGITLDSAGWTDVGKLLPALAMTMAQLEEVVADNDKQRFEFNENKTKIRARQGHSVEVELGYEEKTPPNILFHGTSQSALYSILKDGLRKQSRHHVHLSADIQTALAVAKRRPPAIVLSVDAERMNSAGRKFFLTPNGVWLTDSVPAEYLGLLDTLA